MNLGVHFADSFFVFFRGKELFFLQKSLVLRSNKKIIKKKMIFSNFFSLIFEFKNLKEHNFFLKVKRYEFYLSHNLHGS